MAFLRFPGFLRRHRVVVGALLGVVCLGAAGFALLANVERGPRTPRATPAAATGTTDGIRQASGITGRAYYVSKRGSNGDGRSWETAWTEPGTINWAALRPGDGVVLDGGASSMVYSTSLRIAASGRPDAPIHIERATTPGHDGKVVFFGGRTQPLPACGTAQSAYREQAAGVLGAGIDVGSNSWVVVDGMGWGGIALHGFGWQGGIHMEPAASHDVFRHLEIYDNGTTFKLPDGTWGTISPGVAPHGAYHTFEYLDVHDNAEDSFQGNVDHLTIRYSWLHDDRTLPGRPGASFNYCEHNDGFQIYNGGVQSDLLIEHSVIGPGKSNGLILGNSGATGLNRLTVRDTLLLGANSNSVISNSAPPATGMNWVFDHVTSFSQSDNLGLSTQGATVTNSIFYGGLMLIHDGSVGASSGNCQWRTSGNVDQVRGRTADPRFVTDLSGYVAHTTDIAQLAPMETLRAADLTPRPGSPCAGLGASLSSVGRLLAVVLTP